MNDTMKSRMASSLRRRAGALPLSVLALLGVTPACIGAGDPRGDGTATVEGAAQGGFLGCYADTSDRDLPVQMSLSKNTPSACVDACGKAGYAFAGVQDGRECWCGDSYGTYGPSEGCDMSCSGDAGEVCGGAWANGVYATGQGEGCGSGESPGNSGPAGGMGNGSTYYVSTDGSDDNGCAQAMDVATPLRTIGAGARCLGVGDTLYVRGGEYVEETLNDVIPSGEPGNPVTVSAYPGETVWFLPYDGTDGHGIELWKRSHIVIDCINIDGADISYDNIKIDGDDVEQCHDIVIMNAELKNAGGRQDGGYGGAMGILGGGPGVQFISLDVHHNVYGFYTGVTRGATGMLIQGCRIHDNHGYGIHLYADAGGIDNNVIRDNAIYANGSGFISAGGYLWEAPGMILSRGNNNQAIDNAVFDNVAGGIQADYGLTNAVIEGNSIHGNGGSCIYVGEGASETRVQGNGCEQNSSGIDDFGSGTMLADNTVE